MKVAVNMHPFSQHGGGTRYFVQSLLETLGESRCRPDFSYDLLCSRQNLELVSGIFRRHRNITARLAPDLRGILEGSVYDLYFSPLNSLEPFPKHLPSVAALMDIQERYFPHFFSEGDLHARGIVYPRICRESTVVCTISEFCKGTFVEQFQISEDKIAVVHLAPQRKLITAASVRPAFTLPDSYFLYPASFYKHKNHKNLIGAYGKLKKECLEAPDLVLVGSKLGGDREISEWIRDAGVEGRVMVLESVNAGELRYIYERSRAVLLPTLFEGYCMPLAEAIHFNCDILANDIPSLREVGGGCAVYRNLTEEEDILEALLECDPTDFELCRYADATHILTWNQIADRYLEVFVQAKRRYEGGGA